MAIQIVEHVNSKEGTLGQALQHGWYVVLNRGPTSPASFDRQKEEDIAFNKEPWITIPEERRGTSMLKRFLANILCQKIRDVFPRTRDTVDELLKNARTRLDALGYPRKDHSQQQRYLISIAEKFQAMASHALKTPEELPKSQMKLRGKVYRANKRFADELVKKGHSYSFSSELQAVGNGNGKAPSAQNSEAESESDSDSASHQSLETEDPPLSHVAFYEEIRKEIKQNKGQELPGILNPAVIKPLVLMQAKKWPNIARKHLVMVAAEAKRAMMHILDEVCDGLAVAHYTREALKETVHEFVRGAQERAEKRLSSGWRDNELHLETHDTDFTANVKKAQLVRFEAALQKYKVKHSPVDFLNKLVEEHEKAIIASLHLRYENWVIINLSTIDDLFEAIHSRGENYMVDEVHDLVQAYYEV
jgi:Dynamin central region